MSARRRKQPPTPREIDAALMRLWQADADEQDGGRREKVKRDHGRNYKSTLAVIARVASASVLLYMSLKSRDPAGMERALDRLGKLDPKHPALGIVDMIDDADDVRRAMELHEYGARGLGDSCYHAYPVDTQ